MYKKSILTGLLFSQSLVSLIAQTAGIERGAQTLQALTGDLAAYIDPMTTVVYVVAAIVGLIGALKVYSNWQGANRENIMAQAGGWLGACLFILVANTVLRAMFIG